MVPRTRDEQIAEILKCGRDPVYFIRTYVKIQHPEYGLIDCKTYDFQEMCLRDFVKHRNNIIVKARQLGLSTITAAYALWLALFHKDKNILVIATKLPTAVNFIKKVKVALQNLPKWLMLTSFTSTFQSVKFGNRSVITALPTSEDVGRSESVSLLVCDECVTGLTSFTVRNKRTGEIKTVEIEKMYSSIEESIVVNDEWKVLTPSGWRDFSGIKRSIRDDLLKLTFDDLSTIETTPEHLVKVSDSSFKSVKDVSVGEKMSTGVVVVSKEETRDRSEFVYDLLDVEGGHEYLTNSVVSHNCAIIRNFADIWTNLSPTLSLGGQCILLSTPYGAAGQFYKMYVDAQAGLNDFNHICLPWDVHPDHDQDWYDVECKRLGNSKKKIAQELCCDFVASGDTFLQQEDFEYLRSLKDSVGVLERVGVDHGLWVWREPIADHKYVCSADVSRGDASDFSTCHVIDADESEVVAEYKGKMPPDKFADFLFEIGKTYNNALMCPENNTFGYTTVVKLRDLKYPNLYYSNLRPSEFVINQTESSDEIPGFSTQGKSRVQILTKLEEVIRNRVLRVYSSRFYEEIKTFVWTGSKAQASKGNNDDLVISLAIGVWLLGDGLDAGKEKVETTKCLLSCLSISKKDLSQTQLAVLDEVRPLGSMVASLPPPMYIGSVSPGQSSFTKGLTQQDLLWVLK